MAKGGGRRQAGTFDRKALFARVPAHLGIGVEERKDTAQEKSINSKVKHAAE